MRPSKALPLLVATALSGCALDGRRPDWGSGLPPGSYRSACRSIRVDGRLLKARCPRGDGSWRNTSLDLRACDRDIVNWDGQLICGGLDRPPKSNIPRGPYARSCTNIRVRDGFLRADCRANDGSWRSTWIAARACDRFRNDDGRLVCA